MGDRFKRTRVGDSGDHGGNIITGAGTHIINSRKQARKGDIYNCPEHGPNRIIARVTTAGGTTDYISENQKVSHVITIAECGAKIITGSDDAGSDQ